MQQQRRPAERFVKKDEKHRINNQINSKEVRVIGSAGEQIGVVPIQEALRLAEEEGLDLVEVAPEASPPVCKLIDYGKLKYREQKRAAEVRKHSVTHEVKELRVRYSTDKHDLETKVRYARNFLEEGDKVRFQMRFKGREVVYRDLGMEVFNQITQLLSDIAVVEELTPLLGKRMTMTLVPKALAKTS